jgi:transcriptional regulator of acetoin/glycerol metabolism
LKEGSKSIPGRISDFPPELLPAFTSYRWPRNVRQLEQLAERLILLCDGNEIRADDLPKGLDLAAVQKELLTKALSRFRGNQTRAAAYLNISRKTLLHRLTKFGILRGSAAPVGSKGSILGEPA